ncbi:MAG: hypothetical protein ABI142_10100, partial [Bryocella sp.]
MPTKNSKLFQALSTSVCEWTFAQRCLATAVMVGVTVSLALGVADHFMSFIGLGWDAPFYMALSRGDMAHVPQPFALRQLGPLLVKGMAFVGGISLERAYAIECIVALIVLS